MLYVVGIGPGNSEGMTIAAQEAVIRSELIVGYTKYVELIKEIFPDKEYASTGMKHERERVGFALKEAANKTVSLVCSGDSQLYGMAGLAYEMSMNYPHTDIEVIAGVTAAFSGGAVLGSPLTHDFAVVSLSDRLTPWETIEKRLLAAAQADFSIAIYNPASHGRPEHLARACEILLRVLPETRLCGIVRNIGREGQSHRVLTLQELQTAPVDMFCTVFIGNSSTKELSGALITPRGYRNV